jgi:hypothetical protein
MRLAIFGTGGMGRELFDLASGPKAFVTDQPNGPVLGVPVISPDQLEPDDGSLAVPSPPSLPGQQLSRHRRSSARARRSAIML